MAGSPAVQVGPAGGCNITGSSSRALHAEAVGVAGSPSWVLQVGVAGWCDITGSLSGALQAGAAGVAGSPSRALQVGAAAGSLGLLSGTLHAGAADRVFLDFPEAIIVSSFLSPTFPQAEEIPADAH